VLRCYVSKDARSRPTCCRFGGSLKLTLFQAEIICLAYRLSIERCLFHVNLNQNQSELCHQSSHRLCRLRYVST
jgi:hypothetical protein